jgi:flagellar protein FliO/FliZ
MQMLQQFFGEAGARYAMFVLTALGLLIAVLIVWVLIRKVLGSRLNFNDKPDRRGRAPRLGITDSFNVDRDGRRLVVVRRDNVEHLVMIGGPNDILIETNILRGERLTVGRNDQRAIESEQLQTLPRQILDAAPPALTAPAPQAVIAPVAAAPEPVKRQVPIAAQMPQVAPAPAVPPPVVPAPVTTPPVAPAPVILAPVVPAAIVKAPEPVQPPQPVAPPKLPEPPPAPKAIEISAEERLAAEKAIAEINAQKAAMVATNSQTVAANAKEAVSKMLASTAKKVEPPVQTAEITSPAVKPVEAPVSDKPSLTERIKVGGLFGSKTAKTSAPPTPPVTADQELIKTVAAPLPPVEAPPIVKAPPVSAPNKSFMEEMQKLEAAREAKAASADAAPKLPPVPKVNDFKKMTESLSERTIPAPQPVAPSPAPVAPAPVAPVPVAPAQAAPAAAAPPRVASKNPFDSLEEEMAKLLGRAPDGKG